MTTGLETALPPRAHAEPKAPAPVDARVLAASLVLALGALPAVLTLPHDRLAADETLLVLGWLPLGAAGVLLVDCRPDWRLGWTAVLVALAPVLVLVADPTPLWLLPLAALPAAAGTQGAPSRRAARRWQIWLAATVAVTAAASVTAWALGRDAVFGVAASSGLMVLAAILGAAAFTDEPRPVDEPLLDAGLVVVVLATAAAVGALLRWWAQHERIFAADVVGGFAAAVSVVLGAPGAIAVRRWFLARRYGSGLLSSDDVASMTADLGALADPRELLAKAADVVTAASGVAETQVLLDVPEQREGWVERGLVVGDVVVGTLSLRPAGADGLEARQERVVAQLVPTIALVARAVTLAVAAQHARADITRERDAERSRVLSDLHDDLGPMLAGMSMRVRAAQETSPHPALGALADDLAVCRADLRRIVSGLTPPALTASGAATAVRDLVASFRTLAGPEIRLVGDVPDDLEPELAVAVYRTIAEGISNALRHGDPREVVVTVEERRDLLRLVIEDDGHGGVVVAGVGLSSLRARAETLGGSVTWEVRGGGGTRLVLALPGARG